MRRVLLMLAFISLLATLPAARKALLIGNYNYGSKERNLNNPAADTQLLKTVLEEKGFAVTPLLNVNRKAFRDGVREFGEKLRSDDEIIFYFSGHGAQVDGVNYLIPVNADIVWDVDCEGEAVSADWVLSLLANAETGIFILDACRDNPFIRSKGQGNKGLAAMTTQTPSQLIIFATEQGREALDGAANSPFVESLAGQIRASDRKLQDMLPVIKQQVMDKTNRQQSPTAYGILMRDFYFGTASSVTEAKHVEAPRKPSVVIEYGSLNLISSTGGDVWVDGYKLATASPNVSLPIRDLTTGSHNIELRIGSLSATRKATVVKDRATDLRLDIEIPGMVFVNGGTFNNGISNVTVSSFYIDKYELTQSAYQAVMGTNPSYFTGVSNGPVERVSWFNAIEYCNRRSLQEGLTPCYSYSNYGTNPANWPAGWNTSYTNHANVSCNWTANGYRLPTEMEWMYAAKGGNQSQNYTYSGSNDIDAVAWYHTNSGSTTHTVGTKAANELGIFDLSGNVWEWTWDIYGSYLAGAQTDPHGAISGSVRVSRGGGWDCYAGFCSVSYRTGVHATYSSSVVGFRCVRVSP